MTESWIVSSDMDGTLLSHDGYHYAQALPAMKQLQQAGIPLVLNTSKTFAELEHWIERLELDHPFVVENGSAVYLPLADDEAEEAVTRETRFGRYRVVVLGTPIARLRQLLEQTQPEAIDFTRCSLAEAIDLTGLDEASARQARTREFSIPLRFADPGQLAEFRARVQAAGFGLLEGGRFAHLMGRTDKARAVGYLKTWYREKTGVAQVRVAALGDSPNDAAMIDAADIAVGVKSPSSDKLSALCSNLTITRETAPRGWAEGVGYILERIKPKSEYGGLHG
jgi:mannosyl-3-phosphoglycerate phosphatase family protein